MANKTYPEHSSSSKKFTKITIAEVEKAIGTQLDKYTVEAIEQMIRDNYIPDVLFASETWKKDNTVSKKDILEIIKTQASKEFIEKHKLEGNLKTLGNKLSVEKVHTLYMEFYKTHYDKVYMTTKEKMIKQEETWVRQQQIFDKMLEDRKEHVEKCKAEFYENAKQIQEKMDELKHTPCALPRAFPGEYGYQFCSSWRTFYGTALGPNYSDMANRKREEIIELFYSEHPKAKKGYMYKVTAPLPHDIYQGKSSSIKNDVVYEGPTP